MRKQILSSEEHAKASEAMAPMARLSYEVGGLVFVQATGYTTFRAEYGAKDGKDLVFHFFGTHEANSLPDPWDYWLQTFPRALQKVAVEHFRTGPPHLKAAYAEELVSWWLQADGAAEKTLDVDAYAASFLDKLDEELEQMTGGVPCIST